jgi:hypothetical protein
VELRRNMFSAERKDSERKDDDEDDDSRKEIGMVVLIQNRADWNIRFTVTTRKAYINRLKEQGRLE